MVQLPAHEMKGKKLFKGYFNYRILNDPQGSLKTYNFSGYPKSLVEKLRTQFQNVRAYHFFGEKVVRARELEKITEKND